MELAVVALPIMNAAQIYALTVCVQAAPLTQTVIRISALMVFVIVAKKVLNV